ncbi:MAG: hypothetical protein KAI79_04545 [Bacteroidales bacterium]|nr:hypothetical protein [Bacteroidales bacterium]
MKKILLLVVIVYTSVFADIDMDSYKRYKKTDQYQIAAAKAKGSLYTDMYARYSKEDNMLHWGLTLKKIENVTGSWADIGAIAKANHENFIYMLLTPVLKGSHDEEVYKGIKVQRKIMFGRKNKVSFTSPIPQNINFKRVTISIGLITDNSKNITSLNKPKHINNERKKEKKKITKEERQAYEQKRLQYRKEVQALNESIGIKETLKEFKKEKEDLRKEAIRKASTQEACLGYLKAVNEIMRKDDERIKPTELVSSEALQSTKKSIVASKKALVYADKYKKYNCKRFINTDKPTKTYKAQNSYSSNIMSNCEGKWGTDYRMVKYCVDKQTKAFREIDNVPNGIIKQQCEEKWGVDYRMVKYCVDKQTEAKRSLGL